VSSEKKHLPSEGSEILEDVDEETPSYKLGDKLEQTRNVTSITASTP